MTQAATLVQIGQLLTKSGLLSAEQLAEALIRSKERGLPIGTILLTMGHLRQEDLRAAVEAQSMVNDGVVPSDTAVNALAMSAAEGKSFEDSLLALGFQSRPVGGGATNRLGELLIDAGVINESQLSESLRTSQETGMPLGRVLTFKRMITEEVLVAALRAQRYVREGALPRHDVVDVLKNVHHRKVSLDETLTTGGYLKPRLKKSTPVGYLLVEAGYLQEVSLMMCVEMSLSDNKPMVETLVEQGFTSQAMAQAALVLQQLLDNGVCAKALAVAALRIVSQKGVDANRALAEAGMPTIDESHRQLLHTLLVLCGTIDAKQNPVISGDLSSYEALQKTVGAVGNVPDWLTPCVVRALFLIDAKMLSNEDAVMALHYCRRNQTSLEEALTIMGWKPPTAVKI